MHILALIIVFLSAISPELVITILVKRSGQSLYINK